MAQQQHQRRQRNRQRRHRLVPPSLALALFLTMAPTAPTAASAAATTIEQLDTSALFAALDADRDGTISPTDLDESAAKVLGALGLGLDGGAHYAMEGIDVGREEQELYNAEGEGDAQADDELGLGSSHNMGDGGAGAGAGAPSRNANANAAVSSRHRDGLTGEVRPGGRSFHPHRSTPKAPPGAGAKSTKSKDRLSFANAFTASVAMILATEIGDKTFFIAAVLSMRNDRLAVFGGAILALIVMTCLSTMMGLILPSILPRRYTHIIGGLLFLYFGIMLVLDSRTMEDKVSDELEEVEEELGVQQGGHDGSTNKKDEDDDVTTDTDGGNATDTDLENGRMTKRRGGGGGGGKGTKTSPPKRAASGLSSATAYKSSNVQKIFLQALTLTFLAEWGDRSQIATIALAAAKDPVGVTVGGCLGHSICTGMAVLGGRMLASRISERTVSFWGGIIFNIFGLHSLFFEA